MIGNQRGSAWKTDEDLLVGICRCPVMERILDGRADDHLCAKVVLHQWSNVPSVEARSRRWRREHQTPVPWVGHLGKAPILFISSNPNLPPRDLRKAEELPIPEPEPLPELLGKSIDEHPSLRMPFRAPKWYWEAEEMVDAYQSNFDVWVKEDGITPLSGSSRRRAKVPFWEFARDQAQELILGRSVRAGHDYALAEVVHCKSAEEDGVDKALQPCANEYLAALIGRSPASVLIVTGAQAAEGLRLIFGLPAQLPGTLIEPVRFARRERFVFYTRHPGWLRRNPQEAAALTLPNAISPKELSKLRAAVGAVPSP